MNPDDSITTHYTKIGDKWKVELILRDGTTIQCGLIPKLQFNLPIHPDLREENYFKCDQIPARTVPMRFQRSLRGNYRGKTWNC